MYFYRRQTNTLVSNFRINFLLGIIFLLILILICRLFYLQVIKHEKYQKLAVQQHQTLKIIQPERGEIYALANNNSDAGYYPLAVNQIYYEVYANPSEITRPENLAEILAMNLSLDKQDLLPKLKLADDQYEILKKEATEEEVEKLQADLANVILDINQSADRQDQKTKTAGIYWDKKILRFYPDKEVGANLIGFLGYDNEGILRVGKYGLEGYWEKELSGEGGQVVVDQDLAGRLIPFFNETESTATNGANLYLTIDRNVQYHACRALEKAVARYGAQSGSVIVMESSTGAIRAMCNAPDFDPNHYSQVDNNDVYNNNAVYHSYEPGSVMKAIAMAVALDTGKVTPTTIYDDKGEEKIASYTIRNSDLKAHGLVNMTDVLVGSYNTGIIFATAEVNNKIFEDYLKKFGFGKPTEIPISQETGGDISSLAKRGDIFKATASYGQGITVTALQLVSAFNAIATGGQLLQPFLVSKVEQPNGQTIEYQPKVLRRVIAANTASTLSAMLVEVVDNDQGHAQLAGVEGYYVAGKTGTAQVAAPGGGYAANKFIHSFVGFAPINNPKFTMITKLDYPTATIFAEGTATPLFGEIAKFLLEYYQVPPER